jgi:hypothetical protein
MEMWLVDYLIVSRMEVVDKDKEVDVIVDGWRYGFWLIIWLIDYLVS